MDILGTGRAEWFSETRPREQKNKTPMIDTISNSLFSMQGIFFSDPAGQTLEPTRELWFVFQGEKLLTTTRGQDFILPSALDLENLLPAADHERTFGAYNGHKCRLARLDDDAQLPDKVVPLRLRQTFGHMDDDMFRLAGRALQLLHWDTSNQFCGRCGSVLTESEREPVKQCLQCSLTHYPRLSPAVIMTVERGHEILLARSHHFPKGMYSTLAGFVEPGETLEEAVSREIREESGVRVSRIQYFGSQPWPFPHSLMIGFVTRFQDGEIRMQSSEIEDARWFSRDKMPLLPSAMSIARALINNFLQRTED
ncbi:MAG: NAD(+) diphosphatase [Pseudomonadota bacterium]